MSRWYAHGKFDSHLSSYDKKRKTYLPFLTIALFFPRFTEMVEWSLDYFHKYFFFICWFIWIQLLNVTDDKQTKTYAVIIVWMMDFFFSSLSPDANIDGHSVVIYLTPNMKPPFEWILFRFLLLFSSFFNRESQKKTEEELSTS